MNTFYVLLSDQLGLFFVVQIDSNTGRFESDGYELTGSVFLYY